MYNYLGKEHLHGGYVQIFEQESGLIHDNATKAIINCAFKSTQPKEIAQSSLTETSKASQYVTAAKYTHPLMLYPSAILVSAQANANDDLWLPAELWAAKETIIDVPYNLNHEAKKIIGHAVGKRCLNGSGEVISEDTSVDDLPDYLEIEVDLVLYQHIFKSEAGEIAQGFKDQNRGISLEVNFGGFDYGIYDNSGNDDITIINRNKSTAFLTKYLSAYGGQGVYDGKRIVRALKNFVFIGIGDTENPADYSATYTAMKNIDPEIAKSANKDVLLNVASIKEDITTVVATNNNSPEKGNEKMFKTVEEAVAHIETLDKELKTLKDKNAELSTSIADNSDKLVKAEGKISVYEQVTKDLESAKAENAKLKTDLDTTSAELTEIKNKAKANSRLSDLKSAGYKPKDEAKELDKLGKMSDETFADMLEFAKQVIVKAEEAPATETKTETVVVTTDEKKDVADVASNTNATPEVPDFNKLVAHIRGSTNKKGDGKGGKGGKGKPSK